MKIDELSIQLKLRKEYKIYRKQKQGIYEYKNKLMKTKQNQLN